jgi:release factor glutamine methyltransferase
MTSVHLNQKTVGEIFEEVHALLEKSRIEEARQNAKWIISEILNFKGFSEVYLNRNQEVSDEMSLRILNLAQKRSQGIPLQYLLNSTEFFSLRLHVNSHCLIPRPETEILVEHALRYLKDPTHCENGETRLAPNILDIGTGSGNIAIAIAKNLQPCKILAIDVSEEALKLALKNIEMHGCESQIKLVTYDITQGLYQDEPFDLIVSNPPYIDEEDWYLLSDEVRLHEPKIALDGGEKGMRVISKVIENASRLLRPRGALMIEISGAKQTSEVLKTLKETNSFQNIDVLRDYRFEDRIVKAIRKQNG